MSDLTRVRRNKGLSLVLIAIIAVSTLTAITPLISAATAPPNAYNISWKKEPFNEVNNWSWKNIQWLFGPQIEATVALLNGSLLYEAGKPTTHYLFPFEQFYVNISVPKSVFEPGRNASQIMFNMNKNEGYQNGTMQYVQLWNAMINMQCMLYQNEQGSYSGSGGGKTGGSSGNNPSVPNWQFYSQLQNNSVTGGSSGPGPGTVPGPGPQPRPTLIFQENLAACKFVETPDYYYVWFQGQLNSSSAIKGNFWFNINVMDTKGTQISSSSGTGGSMGQGLSGNIIVIRPDPNMYMGGSNQPWYNFDMTDTTGESNRIVTPGTEFKIVFDIEGTKNVKNVTLYLQPPVNWDWWGNTTGTHPKNTLQLVQGMSVWCTEGYQWNGSAWLTGGYWTWAQRQVRITCNVTGSGEFRIDEGYRYDVRIAPSWDWSSQSSKWIYNRTDFSYFYDLNKTTSKVHDSSSGNGKQVEFVIKVKPSANASAGTYWFDHWVFNADGIRMNGGGNSQFAILGLNVVRVKLMKLSSDKLLTKITPGKFFRAAFEVSGTQALREVLLGHTSNITFQFGAPGTGGSPVQIGDWQHSTYSNLQYYLTMNTTGNKLSVEIYNNTQSNWWNTKTCQGNNTWDQKKLADWSPYIELGSPNFTHSYNSTTNILTLAFNFTFKPSVQVGWYWWDGRLMNRTYWTNPLWWNGTQFVTQTGHYDQDYNQWFNDESLRCTITKVPDTSNIQVGEVGNCWNYWGATQKWNTDPSTGALDLDGNNLTTNDQFYVKKVYNSTNRWSQSGTRMMVNINWGSYNMWSYFALVNYTWSNEWTEYYYWFYAGNRSHVPQDRFAALINSTVWDLADNGMRPEYSQISSYTINRTWDRIVAENSKYGWWQPSFSWNWLEIRFDQNFFTPSTFGGSSSNIFFQYAGLLLFNDTNKDGVLNMGFVGGQPQSGELSHYFMFEKANGVNLTTPQPGVNNGSMQVPVNSSVSWGVSALGINGTTYPTNVYGMSGFAGLDWWWHDSLGKYVTTGNFSSVPAKVGIDSLSFMAHFSIPHANMTAGAVNEVRVKIDEAVGAWTLFGQPQSALNNYSLAIAFLASSMQMSQYSFKTSKGAVTTENSTASDSFNVTDPSGVKLANVQLGGFDYTWGKDGMNYSMHSCTTPMSAFSAMYSGSSMGGSGAGSITSFSVTGTNYFISSTFENWGGYTVSTDPYFAVFTSNNTPSGGMFGGMTWLVIIAAVGASSGAVFLVVRRSRKGKKANEAIASQKEDQ